MKLLKITYTYVYLYLVRMKISTKQTLDRREYKWNMPLVKGKNPLTYQGRTKDYWKTGVEKETTTR